MEGPSGKAGLWPGEGALRPGVHACVGGHVSLCDCPMPFSRFPLGEGRLGTAVGGKGGFCDSEMWGLRVHLVRELSRRTALSASVKVLVLLCTCVPGAGGEAGGVEMVIETEGDLV